MAITERLTDQAAKQALPDLDMPLPGDDEPDAAGLPDRTRAARLPGLIGRARGSYGRLSPRLMSRMVPFWVPIGGVIFGAGVLLAVRFVG